MPSTQTLTEESRFVGLFVGPSKCGKTVAECSFPGPIEVWDFDGRIRGILGCEWTRNREDITYEYFLPREPNLVDKLNKKLEMMLLASTMPGGGGIKLPKTFIMDSLTSQTFAMVQQSIPISHASDKGEKKGKWMGALAMQGPEDYNFEANATYSILSFLRTLPIQNIIVSAHVVDRYGKPPGDDNKYADRVKVGEQLSIRPKIAENVGIYFDHCFRFNKIESASSEMYTVKFRGELPYGTAYSQLPAGEIDITGKNFYELLMSYVAKPKLEVVSG